ncbi:hypothetical protein R1flu_004138 [Riccia fluitans]|uniref:ZZ-type domain-containing protein n=1 Tax=Riccia fluitans TaxID=41844 RepID=A0ABD1YPF0_9MARC
MAFVLKVEYEGELRRVLAKLSEEGEFSFAEVEKRIRDVFDFPRSSELKLTYQDRDGDIVTMGNDQDLTDGCIFQELNPLRLQMTLLPTSKLEPADMDVEAYADQSVPEIVEKLVKLSEPVFRDYFTAEQMPEVLSHIVGRVIDNISFIALTAQRNNPKRVEEKGATHLHVTCDNCKISPIVGPRYKSMKKFDYDLCSKCYVWVGNEGEYRRVVQPLNYNGPAVGALTANIGGLSLHPEPTGSETNTPTDGNKTEEQHEVHPTVTCDVCEMKPIVGPRYKSMKIFNYDLCGSCFASEGNAVEYRRMAPPLPRPCPASSNIGAFRPIQNNIPVNMMWRSIPGIPLFLGPRGGRCRMGYVRS